MSPQLQVLGWAFTAVIAVVGYMFTRRSAQDTTGVAALSKLTDQQAADKAELKGDLAKLRTAVREHRTWDDKLYDQARAAGWDVPPPPPLD